MTENVLTSSTEVDQKIPDPSKIMQIGLGFWASKALLSATKLGLFSLLGKGAHSAEEIKLKLGLTGPAVRDWLDALLSLGFLERDGNGSGAMYKNTEETAFFLDSNKPGYIGGFFEMANDREYLFWADLEEALKTGKPQNEIKDTGLESFDAIYKDEDSTRKFTDAMTSIQLGSFMAFAQTFDFSQHKTLLDVGGSGGVLSSIVAAHHPHMKAITFDLPHVEELAKEATQKYNVADRVSVKSGNMFTDEFPATDLITMGNLLHSFDMEKKQLLLKKAYDALPSGGELVVIELIMDSDRRQNTMAFLMSLNMLIESDGGFNYSQADLESWGKKTGFSSISFYPLAGPVTAAVLKK